MKYKHVIVVGIDGAGSFFREAETPVFDRIFQNGAVTYHALASNPTISAECWGAMLLGVGPKVHKLTNSIVSSTPYPHDSAVPSLFRRIREAMPDAELGSFCDWNPITYGIVEDNIGVTHDTDRDTVLTTRITEYIKAKKPVFLFIQMDSADGAGHSFGYGSPEHLKRIGEVDVLIGDIYDAVRQTGMLDDTLFCVIADHGGTPFNGKGAGHGGWSDAEKYVTFAAAGKTVSHCEIEEMNVRDLAAIVLYALNISAPEFCEGGWTSQIPGGMFKDSSIPPYRGISEESGAESVSKEAHTSQPV
ncbi:MAG: alkaline phosphatase family protein [Eubacteriales bacterium]